MKKAIQITSVASMIDQFNRDNISILQKMGYKVDVAANFSETGSISKERACCLKDELDKEDVDVFDVDIPRSIFKISKIIKAYKKLKKISTIKQYEIVHCHSPIGGALARLAFRKSKKSNVIYTAHGFHFYKGAPMINWLLFYPIEKLCANFTDILITVNTEDFEFAQKKMKAKSIEYIPGVGVDINAFDKIQINREQKRKEFNIPKDSIVIISVGEVNENKNHIVVVKALSMLKSYDIHYCIVGKGNLKKKLMECAEFMGIADKVHIIGYRNDIAELNYMSDIFAFPSKREGLGLAAIEGMACGLPLICSDNRGSREYAVNEYNAYVCNPDNVEQFAEAIKNLIDDRNIANVMGRRNKNIAKKFDKEEVNGLMKRIYERCENK